MHGAVVQPPYSADRLATFSAMEDLDGMSTRGLAWLVFLPECRPDAFLGIKLLNASNADRGNIDPMSNGSLSFRGILAPRQAICIRDGEKRHLRLHSC